MFRTRRHERRMNRVVESKQRENEPPTGANRGAPRAREPAKGRRHDGRDWLSWARRASRGRDETGASLARGERALTTELGRRDTRVGCAIEGNDPLRAPRGPQAASLLPSVCAWEMEPIRLRGRGPGKAGRFLACARVGPARS